MVLFTCPSWFAETVGMHLTGTVLRTASATKTSKQFQYENSHVFQIQTIQTLSPEQYTVIANLEKKMLYCGQTSSSHAISIPNISE